MKLFLISRYSLSEYLHSSLNVNIIFYFLANLLKPYFFTFLKSYPSVDIIFAFLFFSDKYFFNELYPFNSKKTMNKRIEKTGENINQE